MENKKKIILSVLVILLLLAIGVTYAFFTYENGERSEIVTGQIYMNYEETSTISLMGVFPETKSQALARQDNNGVFEFTITGRNTSQNTIYYEIDLLEGGLVTGATSTSTKILPEHVRIHLERDGEVLIDGETYTEWDNRRIHVDTVPAGTTDNIEHKYKLRMWIDENVTISDTDPNTDYTTSEWNNSYASLKVRVVGDFKEKKVPFNLTDKIQENLVLTEADSDGTRFVTGTNPDNYVWYSGKLWRIVSINNDGTIKLATQGNMTTIAWDTSDANTNYSTSQIRNWLNSEFLPTINANLIVNRQWDYTIDTTADTSKPETINYVEDMVGLLTIYDYYMAGGVDGYLKNGYVWWTMTPRNNTEVWQLSHFGNTTDYLLYPTNTYGVRPVVNMKDSVLTDTGTGTVSDPYQIIGDTPFGLTGDNLNTRSSGEYIKFNNVLYRIVGTETIGNQVLTKVTMADYSVTNNTITTVAFGNNNDYSIENEIGLYLNNWFNATSSDEMYSTVYINDTYKKMIATTAEDGVVWYQGPETGVSPTESYTLAKTGTAISATIGLPYYGEMFSSHFGDGYGAAKAIWTMTKYSDAQVFIIGSDGCARNYDPSSSRGIRPSFYLKSDVKITGGSGMPHDPYTLTQ